MSVLPLLLGWPLLLYPMHIVFLELVIDPACSIAFEAEPADRNVMHRPPRAASARLFDRWMLGASVGQGTVVLLGVALLYGGAIGWRIPEDDARAMGFTAIVLANVALIFGNRSRVRGVRAFIAPNAAMWSIAGGAIAALALTLCAPALREIFRFGAPTFAELCASALPALVVLSAMMLIPYIHADARL
jgi:Ca2+-transporting ATPase